MVGKKKEINLDKFTYKKGELTFIPPAEAKKVRERMREQMKLEKKKDK